MTTASAVAALDEGLRAIALGKTVFDLSAIQSVDSAAVAILLAWQRAAHQRHAPLVFAHPPESLCTLAALYGVAEFLQLSGHLEVAQPH